MKKLLFLALLYSCATHTGTITIDKYTDFVDPLIGSGGHGHVFVGANVPHGMVQLGPTQMSQGWDWSSGYHSSDSTISGFGMTHLSGTGIGDKGDIHFMPTTGGVALRRESFFSSFSHSQEQAEAGFYSVMLLKYGIQVQLTASERTGFQRYIFPFGKPVELIIDLKQGIGWDWPTGCELRQVSPTKIEGLRLSTGWAKDDRIYFTASFSHPITALEVASDTSYNPHNKQIVVVDSCYYRLVFAPIDTLECQVAISGVDIQGARANFESEARGRSFEQIRSQAQQSWNSALGVVQAEGADSSRLRTFYTALYHTMFFPSIFSDVDGRYRGADGNTHKSSNFKSYTIFSLWDTYRAAHPLFTLTEPDRVSDMVNSMLAIYDEQGKLPVWHLWGNETDCMVGFGSVQVIADAMLKGVKGFDYQRAYEALKAYAKLDERGLKLVRERGYIPADSMGES
ncbi:MAG: GH92 family glycosyl hydrolase, partial [Mucinivorans sp.]